MQCVLEWRVYQRSFKQPLATAHGLWAVREGIILRLTDAQGHIGYGEIAPLPWFGSETLADAIALCQSLPSPLTWDAMRAIPDHRPACQFGFESAAWDWHSQRYGTTTHLRDGGLPFDSPHLTCGLLTTGESALTTWPALWQAGHRTLKWKIGVAPIDQELTWFDHLVTHLPEPAQLRLDANGGLTQAEAEQWLTRCDALRERGNSAPCPTIEFLEQPLPPSQFSQLQQLSQRYHTPLALDESVATLAQLMQVQAQGWQGILVLKPAIAGFPSRLLQYCRDYDVDCVISSVFETGIGRSALLTWVDRWAGGTDPLRALGLGTVAWFADDWLTCTPEMLWRRLS